MSYVYEWSDSLCCDLDELLEELDAFAERGTQTNLCDHPQLNLIKAPQEQIQISRGLLEMLTAKRVVDQLMLKHKYTDNY